MTTTLSTFARAYIKAALWASTDSNGTPLDAMPGSQLAEETAEAMAREADAFAEANREDIGAARLSDDRAGFLFWLNRNGHGSGFWDEKMESAGDDPAECAACSRLSEASKKAGERDLYLGDDGRIYQS